MSVPISQPQRGCIKNREGKEMANTYYSVYEHIVFSVKKRVRVLSPKIRKELFSYVAGAIGNLGCFPLIVGGWWDHVHILVRKRSTVLTSDLVKEIKRTSSKWLKGKGVAYGKFSWQVGYGAFSISFWDVDKIIAYIDQQEKHHEKMRCEDEYRKLLKRHGVKFDERYFLD
jgi:putative transposase